MSGFGYTKTRKGIFMIGRRPSLDLMPPARVIAGPRALLTSILLVTRVSGIRGAGGQTLAHKQRLAPVGRSQDRRTSLAQWPSVQKAGRNWMDENLLRQLVDIIAVPSRMLVRSPLLAELRT
jgi:hypothetical protein